MNEASNFCDGQCTTDTTHASSSSSSSSSPTLTHTYPAINNPPYRINNGANSLPLNTKAIDVDATHARGLVEYDVHSLFGLGESIATKRALESVTKKRSFVLSRSTFSGSGAYTAHWYKHTPASSSCVHVYPC